MSHRVHILSRQHQSHLYVWLLQDLLGLGHLGGGYSVANRLVVLACQVQDHGDEEQRPDGHPDEDWHIVKAVTATRVSWVNDGRDGRAAHTVVPGDAPGFGLAIDQKSPGPASGVPLPSAAPDFSATQSNCLGVRINSWLGVVVGRRSRASTNLPCRGATWAPCRMVFWGFYVGFQGSSPRNRQACCVPSAPWKLAGACADPTQVGG